MKSLPFTPRTLVASEARLERIYEAAKNGLRGENLALAANMLPVEYERLKAMDPIVEMAELKGRADMEAEMAGVLIAGARSGDIKAAQFLLTHRADWVAKQQISVDVNQQISIVAALEQAQRYAQTFIIDEAQDRANGPGLLTNQPVSEADNGYAHSDTGAPENASSLRS